MLLTLPSIEPSRVAGGPCAVIAVNGARYAMHLATPAVHTEAPVFEVSHCTSCGCKASEEIRQCPEPVCPSRDRKAA